MSRKVTGTPLSPDTERSMTILCSWNISHLHHVVQSIHAVLRDRSRSSACSRPHSNRWSYNPPKESSRDWDLKCIASVVLRVPLGLEGCIELWIDGEIHHEAIMVANPHIPTYYALTRCHAPSSPLAGLIRKIIPPPMQ